MTGLGFTLGLRPERRGLTGPVAISGRFFSIGTGMESVTGTSKVREASIQAVIIRKDGSREDLGVVSYWHRNPFKRLWWTIKQNWK